MDATEYIEQRVEDQVNWMNGKSKRNKKRFYFFTVFQLIISALIPWLASINFDTGKPVLSLLIGGIGVLVVVTTGILSVGKYHENWIRYRSCTEKMISHKFKYLTGAMPYNTDNSFELFVMNIESLLSEENISWAKVVSEIKVPESQKPKPEDPE